MRDGIELARRGIPAVALVTETFWVQGDFVADASGMPELPRLGLPHPVAGSGEEAMRQVAEQVSGDLIALLRGDKHGAIAGSWTA